MRDYRRILVPFDFSEHAREALDVAVDLAHRFGSDIHVVHVVQHPVLSMGYAPHATDSVAVPFEMKALREDAERALREIVAAMAPAPAKVTTEVCEGSNIASAIEESAEAQAADLIVMGTHGRTGFAHVFIGSVTERVIRRAPCAVLTVRARDEVGGGERPSNP